jgi:hypothetical protein
MRQFAENTTLTFTYLAVEFASSMGAQADSPSGVVVGVHLDSFVVRQPTASQRARGLRRRRTRRGLWRPHVAVGSGRQHAPRLRQTSRAVPLRHFEPRPCTQVGPSTSSEDKGPAGMCFVLPPGQRHTRTPTWALFAARWVLCVHEPRGRSVQPTPRSHSLLRVSLARASTSCCRLPPLRRSRGCRRTKAAHVENVADKHGRNRAGVGRAPLAAAAADDALLRCRPTRWYSGYSAQWSRAQAHAVPAAALGPLARLHP